MRDVEGIGASTRECSMIQLSKMSYWLIIMVVLLATNLTMLSVEANDASVSQGTRPLGNVNEIDSATKVELQPKAPTSPNTMVGIDPVVAVEIKRLFNELERERLSNRSGYIDSWLAVVAIVLTFFAVVIAVLGIFGYRRFRELEADAKKHVEEIKEHHAQSRARIQEMHSEDIDDPDKASEVEEAVREVRSNPEPPLIDKVIAEIYTLQRDGKIESVIEKWRSIANIAEGNDNELAARAWLSIRYFLTEEEEQLAAYNKAMNLDPGYTLTYMNQYRTKYSNLSPHGAVVGVVRRYFNDSKFEKFSTKLEYQIESGHYRADVVLKDEKGQLTIIVECMVNEYIPTITMTHLKEHFRRSGAQFGLLAAGIDFSNWTFFRMLEDEFTEITRSQFEEELLAVGSS